jgi:hypothetical protein
VTEIRLKHSARVPRGEYRQRRLSELVPRGERLPRDGGHDVPEPVRHNGYYRYYEEWSDTSAVQDTDEGPGQSMQPTMYTAYGGAIWTICAEWLSWMGCGEQIHQGRR